MARAVIFLNGRIPDLELVRRLISPYDTLIAADGGTRLALALGLAPSIIIGDLDSLTDEHRHELDAAGTEIRQYPRNKNETDFELVLRYAVDTGYREILIVAALGDRLDQTLGNLSLLTAPFLVGLDVRVDDGMERAYFVRTHVQVEGRPGDLVSLIPWGEEVTGVTTIGLRWPLRDETLYPYQTRGISNELLGETASVSLKSGLLLVVHSRNWQS